MGMGILLLLSGQGWAREKDNKIKLSIDQFVRLALRQSDDVRVAVNNFQVSLNNYRTAFRQSRLPSSRVSGSASQSHTDVNSSETDTDRTDLTLSVDQPIYWTGSTLTGSAAESTTETDVNGVITETDTGPDYSATLTQPLYLFNGNTAWRGWKRSRINYEIAEDNYRRTLQTIRNTARRLYFDVLRNRAQLKVEKFKLESSRKAHLITRAMVKAGRLARIESSRSSVRLNRDKRRLENAETALEQAINNALDFVTLNLDAKYEFTSTLDYTALKIPLKRLLDYAFHHRTDYKASERRLELSELAVKETKEQDNPNLNLSGTISRAKSETGGSNSTTKSWSGILSLSWPFFDSRVTRLAIQNAERSLENDRIAFEGLKRSIEKEVRNAYLDVKKAELQIDDLKKSRDQARRAVNVVRTRYKNGIDRLIDVFDSENELRQVEIEYLDALISANLSQDNLELQIGGSLDEVEP